MQHLVISYPAFTDEGTAWINEFRTTHPYLEYPRIPPHVTFVFPTDTHISTQEITAHTKARAATTRAFDFVCRCAMPVKDLTSPLTHLFLTPDEGFSDVVRLHDALYTGPLTEQLRLDIPFIPHITLGYAEDHVYCKTAADTANAERFEVRGSINELTIMSREGSRDWETIAEFPLGA